MAVTPGDTRAETGAQVLEAAVLLAKGAADGKMVTPYWLWESAGAVLPARVRGFLHHLVQEKLLQHFTWHVVPRAHETSPESYDRRLQDQFWDYAELRTH